QVPVRLGAGDDATSVVSPTRRVSGVAGTPQGPLWQINSTNRGAWIADPGPPGAPSAENTNNTFFNNTPVVNSPDPDPNVANRFFLPSRNVDGLFPDVDFDPSPGITLLPGAVPLFKSNGTTLRLVGGVGVVVLEGGEPNVDAAEYAAIQGASGSGAL